MSPVQLIVILLGVSAALQLVARRFNVPHPALLVLGGLGIAFVPGLPRVAIAPETLFLVFVPPLLYWAALRTTLRDFWRAFGPIARYATLVVILTMVAVAIVVRQLSPEFTWPAAFLLGAIVAPPDPVAAIAVLRSIGAPRAISTILEGEGLVNDATALVSYQIAVAAGVAGTFSIEHAAMRFLIAAAGGIGIGLATGWLVAFARRKLIGRYPIVENTLSLLTPFIAYLPANWINASGILSVVTIGLYLGRRGPRIVSPATRIQAEAMWSMVQFLLESMTFILVGLELPVVVHALRSNTFGTLVLYCALILVTVILVRVIYTFIAVALLRLTSGRNAEPSPSWEQAAFLGWTGLRGGDSLIIALAIPFTTASGQPFPARDLIIFVTFGVIFGTLVLQGFTLVPLLHVLHLSGGGEADGEEAHARRVVAEAGLEKLNAIAGQRPADATVVRLLRDRYRGRLRRWAVRDRALHSGPNKDADHQRLSDDDAGEERHAESYRAVRGATIDAERKAVIDLRDNGTIGDDVMRRVQRELDLESMMLDSIEDDVAEPYDEP
ncbi:MAG TPA: Na+/H+ antiporter [Gemmatimonadaceae bacterium]|jgi:CPA1 family monovalent cation:H+ antiporter